MLVLSRKVGERILIGDEIAVTIVRVSGGGVRLGIEAPADMTVVREELQAEFEAPEQPVSEPVGGTSQAQQTETSQSTDGSLGPVDSPRGRNSSAKDASSPRPHRPGPSKPRRPKPR